MKLGDWIQQSVSALRASGHEEPQAAVEFLVAHAWGCGRLDVARRADEALPDGLLRTWDARMARLIRQEPLQYVLGDVDFLGRTFLTDGRALIPRPETEALTEEVLADDDIWRRPAPVAVDVGTGSGCIAITLCLLRPHAQVEAVDISPDALALARENAARHGVDGRLRIRQADLLEGVAPASVDVVVSNPPYVPTEEWARLPAMIRQYEPRLALDGGEDGMALICRLVRQAAQALKPGGRLLMETGEDQGERLRKLLDREGFGAIELRSDLCGHHRIAVGIRR